MNTFIEVCAGCGGMSTGFIQAGFKPLLLNEINKVYCKTLEHNHPDIKMSQEDVNKLDLTEYKDGVNVLVGGVPCQSFSHAGKRKGVDDDRGCLILRFGELVKQCKPDVFVIENVKGLLTHKNKEGEKTIDIVVRRLLELNPEYTIAYKLLNAYEHGVPQKRERLFIIGTKRAIVDVQYRFPVENTIDRVVLSDVILPLEEYANSPGFTYSEDKKRVMDLVPPGGCWVDLPKDVQVEYMGKILESGGGKRGYAKRLSMDHPSTTLTTSPCQKQTEKCHPSVTRPLNIKEYAAIQTFPKDYMFYGSIAQQYAQIGNAVPVKLAHTVANSIRSYLSNTVQSG